MEVFTRYQYRVDVYGFYELWRQTVKFRGVKLAKMCVRVWLNRTLGRQGAPEIYINVPLSLLLNTKIYLQRESITAGNCLKPPQLLG